MFSSMKCVEISLIDNQDILDIIFELDINSKNLNNNTHVLQHYMAE